MEHTINIPASINDFTPNQLRQVVKLSQQDLTKPQRNIWFLLIMSNQTGSNKQKAWAFWQLYVKPWWSRTLLGRFVHVFLNIDIEIQTFNEEELENIVAQASSVLEDETQRLYIQKIPIIGNNAKRLYGVADYFGDLTFAQFRQAEVAFFDYRFGETKDKALSDLIRVLYRPKKAMAENYITKVINNQLPEVRQMVLMFYMHNRELLTSEFKFVFPTSEKGETIKSMAEYETMWEDTLDEVAGKPDKYQSIDDLNVRYVLKNLDRKIQKIKLETAAYEAAAKQ